MEFQVPRFIEAEPKIFGPLTFKNVVAILIVFAVLGLLFFVLTPLYFLIIAVPVAVATMAVMFGQVNGRPLITFAENLFSYALKNQVYIWSRAKVAEVDEIFHIVTSRTQNEEELDKAQPDEDLSPQNLDQRRRRAVENIAQRLDEQFVSRFE